jgi:hypothetical protein
MRSPEQMHIVDAVPVPSRCCWENQLYAELVRTFIQARAERPRPTLKLIAARVRGRISALARSTAAQLGCAAVSRPSLVQNCIAMLHSAVLARACPRQNSVSYLRERPPDLQRLHRLLVLDDPPVPHPQAVSAARAAISPR